MNKKVIKLLALVLAILTVFGLISCKKSEVQNGFITITDTETLEVKGKIKFSYSDTLTETKKASADALVDAFKKQYPDVSITRDYATNSSLTQRISSGDIGDVFYFAESQAYEFAISNRALMPLQYYMQALNIDKGDVYSGIFDAGLIDGNLYYVARDFNQVIYAYNVDAVEAKGRTSEVVPEWTWAQFLDLCQELTDEEEYYGATMDLTYAPYLIPFLNAYVGKSNWYSLTNKTVDLTSGDALKALEEAVVAHQNGYFNICTGAGQDKFSGKTAVFTAIVYPSVLSYGEAADNKEINWDLINLPLFPYATFGAGSSGFGVYNRTTNPSAAAAFALFLYTQEGQRAFNGQAGGSVPLLASLKDEDFWRHPDDEWSDKNWDANVYMAEEYATVGQFTCILPPDIAECFSSSEISKILVAAINGTQSLTDGFTKLETKINDLWDTLA